MVDLFAACFFVAAVALGFYAGYGWGWEAHGYASKGLRVSLMRQLVRRFSGGRFG